MLSRQLDRRRVDLAVAPVDLREHEDDRQPSAASASMNFAWLSSKRRSAARTQYQITWICSSIGRLRFSAIRSWKRARISSPSWPTSIPSES